MLANGGYAVEPYFIERVLDGDDQLVFAADPLVVCHDCEDDEVMAASESGAPAGDTDAGSAPPADTVAAASTGRSGFVRRAPRAIDARNAWLMGSLLRDVVRRGTGRKALVLERDDLAGKTGTTNDQFDAWFSGFAPGLVATAWIGFDEFRPLGRRETGATAALPMWIAYMKEALEGVPQREDPPPEGIVTVRIDPETGELAGASQEGTVFESFRAERAPKNRVAERMTGSEESGAEKVQEKLF